MLYHLTNSRTVKNVAVYIKWKLWINDIFSLQRPLVKCVIKSTSQPNLLEDILASAITMLSYKAVISEHWEQSGNINTRYLVRKKIRRESQYHEYNHYTLWAGCNESHSYQHCQCVVQCTYMYISYRWIERGMLERYATVSNFLSCGVSWMYS